MILFFFVTNQEESFMKRILMVVGLILTMLLTACGEKKEIAKKEGTLKVGLVLSTGGLGDKSFNDLAYAGMQKAEEELGIEFKYVEPASVTEFEGFLVEFAENDYDLTIGIGFQMADAMNKVVGEYPESKFMLIDMPVEAPNAVGAIFDTEEGSFLAGVLSAMMSENKKVGFIGGMDVPPIREFGNGFMAGARYVDASVETVQAFVGGNSPFNDPAKGKEIALSMNDSGADVIYHAAAGSGNGLFEAARERKFYAVGVDSDQDYLEPGLVLTSMMKKLDTAIVAVIKDLKEGKFEAGTKIFNVANDGVGLTDLTYTKDKISDEKMAKLEEIRKAIISKEIDVDNEISKLK